MGRPGGGGTKYIIDYIIFNKRFKKAYLHCKTYPSADCGCDHFLVIYKFRLTQQELRWSAPKLQYDRFLNYPDVNEKYTDFFKSRYNGKNGRVKSKSDTLREELVSSGIQILLTKLRLSKKDEKWTKNNGKVRRRI